MKIKIKDIRQSKSNFSIFLPRHVICLINTSLSLVTIQELQKLQKRNNVLSLRLSIEDKDLYTFHMIKPKLNQKLDLLLTALDCSRHLHTKTIQIPKTSRLRLVLI